MVALVAMLLVATGGSTRAAQARTSAGTGQASAAPHLVRQAASIAPESLDHTQLHLDLASTPPAGALIETHEMADDVDGTDGSVVDRATVTAVGRAPPAL